MRSSTPDKQLEPLEEHTTEEHVLLHDEYEDTLPDQQFDDTPPAPLSSRKRHRLRFVLNLVFGVSLFVTSFAVVWIWAITRDLPDLSSLENYRPWRITKVRDLDNRVIMELAEQRRRVVSYQALPKHLVHAFVAAEDADFFTHKGLDYLGITRAFWKNLWRRKGAPKQGGSTITQQVVKTFLLSPRQTYIRKIREAMLARKLEANLRKWEILYLYLNQIDLGRGCYGVEEAALHYFGKSAKDLSIAESAILAGIPKNPERYNPANSIRLTTRRRNYVLRMMWRNQYIDEATYRRLKATKVKPPPPRKRPPFQQDYYTAAIKQQAMKILIKFAQEKRRIKDIEKARQYAKELMYRGGLRIETGLDQRAQRLATNAMRRHLRALDRRYGFRGPIQHITKQGWQRFTTSLKRRFGPQPPHKLQQALIQRVDEDGYLVQTAHGQGHLTRESLKWASHRYLSTEKGRAVLYKRPIEKLFQLGDVVWVKQVRSADAADDDPLTFSLEQIPKVQGALVAIDPRSHRVRALVGGWDALTHPFNRALMAKRQPGSAFKPLVYAAALASKKYTAATLVNDTYLELKVGGKKWVPTNSDNTYRNKAIRLRDALTHSVNTVAVRVLDDISPYRVIALARKLGIHSRLTLKPSLALGASAIQPLALTNAYATFAAQGLYDKPVMLTRILTHNGQTIYDRLPSPKRILSRGVSHIVTSMMEDVVRKGTAKKALSLKRPVAGKTGTSNKARNAWFVGYTPSICVGVWIGFDNQKPLGRWESGARTALPLFVDWMKRYHKTNKGRPSPVVPFRVPDDVIYVKIDPDTGELAPTNQEQFIFEAFLQGTQPIRYAHNLGPVANPRDYYKFP